MSKDMLGITVRKLVTLPIPLLGIVCDLLEKLADQEWVEALKRFLRKENPWETPDMTKSSLLEFVTTVNVTAIPLFDVGAHFVVTPRKERENTKVVIGWLGGNIQGLVKSFVEPNVAAATLRVHTLTKVSTDNQIIAELGGEEVAETTFAQMWQMMGAQGHGQEGILLVDDNANIFCVRDAQGDLWAVYCHWSSYYGGWSVEARPIAGPYEWDDGNRVVSH